MLVFFLFHFSSNLYCVLQMDRSLMDLETQESGPSSLTFSEALTGGGPQVQVSDDFYICGGERDPFRFFIIDILLRGLGFVAVFFF